MRDFNAKILSHLLKLTGLRFTKYHRQYETIVYRLVNTVLANNLADGIIIESPTEITDND